MVSKESCFWFVETGLNSLQPASIILQIRVVDINIRPSEFRSCVLGIWDTSVNKTKIRLAPVEPIF